MAAAKPPSNEIAITRIYDAPVDIVWAAWVDPKQVAQWWGPRGFSITTYQKDVRPGGTWTYTMHGPDGTNYENKTLFHEVKEHELLVYDHGGNDDRPPLFRVTVRFKRLGKKTQMDMRMALETPEAAASTRKMIKAANGNSTWDRLGEYLAKELGGKERFIINRSFDAPIDTVFTLWTDPKHVAKWLAPTGSTMEYMEANIAPGGTSWYKMTDAEGQPLYGKAHYREVVRPTRLVYTQHFTDEQGNVARHPMAPTWPETMLTVVEFESEGPETTRVTITWEVEGPCTQEELATFVGGRAGMTGGWTGSFDKLEAYLAERSS